MLQKGLQTGYLAERKAADSAMPETGIISKPRQQNYTVASETLSGARRSLSSKSRILLIADVPNWIFARHCRMLDKFLGDEFIFDVKFMNDPYLEDDYDLIYPLEWNLVPPERIKMPGKYVTGIRTHVSWDQVDFLPLINFLATRFQKVHVVSKRLLRLFSPFLPEALQLSHGIETDLFESATTADQSGSGHIRLGWAGNRMYLNKGFESFIAPLAQLPGVALCLCGYQDRNLSAEEMRGFYDRIDAYICASAFEGSNNALMEAAAMRRAIITTDNGVVPEYLVHGESAIIVEREVPAFVQAVLRLRDDPTLRVRLGNAARESVKHKFEWKDRAEDYRELFRKALSGRDQFHLRYDAARRAVSLPGVKARNSVLRDIPPETDQPEFGKNIFKPSASIMQHTSGNHSSRRVGLFGASSRGKQCLGLLAGQLHFQPVCFFDNDPAKWGTEYENLPVIRPEPSQLQTVDILLVASIHASDIVSQLKALGMSRRIALDIPDLYLRFCDQDIVRKISEAAKFYGLDPSYVDLRRRADGR